MIYLAPIVSRTKTKGINTKEIVSTFMTTDLTNCDKRWSDNHCAFFLFYYYCTILYLHMYTDKSWFKKKNQYNSSGVVCKNTQVSVVFSNSNFFWLGTFTKQECKGWPHGAIHKRRWIFLPFLIFPPPCRNFDPDLPNFHLLISYNIGIWDPP